MTVDYSKPTHWHCPRCGTGSPRYPSNLSGGCHHSDGVFDLLPVFAPIPQGERPEAEEPDSDTVCISQYSGGSVVKVSCRQNSAVAYSEHGDGGRTLGWSTAAIRPWGVDWTARVSRLADAVVWVAQGVLP